MNSNDKLVPTVGVGNTKLNAHYWVKMGQSCGDHKTPTPDDGGAKQHHDVCVMDPKTKQSDAGCACDTKAIGGKAVNPPPDSAADPNGKTPAIM